MNSIDITLAKRRRCDVASSAAPGNDSLAHKQALIESALDEYAQFPAECPRKLQEAIRYSLLTPGKRLRPMLVMLAAEACGGTAEATVRLPARWK